VGDRFLHINLEAPKRTGGNPNVNRAIGIVFDVVFFFGGSYQVR